MKGNEKMEQELIETRTIKDKSFASYVRMLIARGIITKHIKNNHVAYDPKEVEEYRKHATIGRPIKINNE